tara:strand:+ start:82 stop:1425 length:1344 start_codon:yes stop_codon:yes gene_type:complete
LRSGSGSSLLLQIPRGDKLENTKPGLSETENAFQPAREISDFESFAGRKHPVDMAYLGLLTEGSSLAVVGNRGIGKSSLARQIQAIGEGNNDLVDRLELGYGHKFDFLVVYLACGNNVSAVEDLLIRLMSSHACLAPWIYEVEKSHRYVSSLAPQVSAKIFGLGAEVASKTSTEAYSEVASVPQDVFSVFDNVVKIIADEKIASDGILFVVDEFDQIDNPSGFASMLKALATNAPNVRFCIVGVAKDIQDLMREHESSDRLFAGSIISLEPMSADELLEIVNIAEAKLGGWYTFSQDARDKMIGLAAGHPYLVHLVGKFALRKAYRENARVIEGGDIDDVVRTIAESNGDPVLEGRYRKAVASSRQREIVLKSLARSQDDKGEVWTTNAYKVALDEGVDNASQYVGQLVTKEFGQEIEKIRERYYRFKDSLFATYVAARPSMRSGDD